MGLFIRRVFIMFVAVAALSGCRPVALYMIEPSGPPEYKLGWEDGCDTGISSQSAGIFKASLGFRKRPEFYDNPLYNTAWNEGFSYCRFSLEEVGKYTPYN
jgi:hypothetical protein